MTSVLGQSRSRKPRRKRNNTESRGKEPQQTPEFELPVWKKLLFGTVATLLFFALVEVGLYLAGVTTISYRTDPYVGFSSYSPLFVDSARRPAGDSVSVETAPNKLAWFNYQEFPRTKGSGSYRIFALGGSTTYGRPYDDMTSFPGWLRELLPVAALSGSWEVVNAGGISYASYRVARLMEELVEYDPDLFVVYSGHNEFLERRTYSSIIETPQSIRDVDSALSGTRIYSVLKRLLDKDSAIPRSSVAGSKEELEEEVKSILDKSVGPEVYRRDDHLQKQILDHYRFNLIRMIEIARSAGAKVIFIAPASNLRNCAPFKSEHGKELSEEQRWRVRELLQAARQSENEGRYEEALEMVEEGLALDGRFAHLHYLYGQILWELGRDDDARLAFVKALDEDVCPLRALSPMTETLLEVGQQFGVPVVDFPAMLDGRAERGIPGEDWFLDHVHPTISGNRLMALSLIDTMAAEGLLRLDSSWGEESIRNVTERVEGRIDRQAHATALRNLSKVLGWAGKLDEAEQLAISAREILGEDDPEAEYQAGIAYLNREDYDRAIDSFEQALELRPEDPRALFGLAKALEAKQDFAQAINFYLRAIELDPGNEDPHYNLARVYEQVEDLNRATKHYKAAIGINPQHFYSHNNLGAILAQENRLEEAQQHFLAAVRVKPDLAHTHVNIGMIYEMQGEAGKAAAAFQSALKSQPDHFGAAFHLVAILATYPDASVRDGATALYWARKLAYSEEMARFWGDGARPADFGQPVVLTLLAASFAETGDFSQAVATQQAAIDLLPSGRKAPYLQLLERYNKKQRYPSSP